jgi:hypothetical protein
MKQRTEKTAAGALDFKYLTPFRCEDYRVWLAYVWLSVFTFRQTMRPFFLVENVVSLETLGYLVQ